MLLLPIRARKRSTGRGRSCLTQITDKQQLGCYCGGGTGQVQRPWSQPSSVCDSWSTKCRQTAPLAVLAAIPSCCGVGEPSLWKAAPGGWVRAQGVTLPGTGDSSGRRWLLPLLPATRQHLEACVSLSDFPKGEIEVKMDRKAFQSREHQSFLWVWAVLTLVAC